MVRLFLRVPMRSLLHVAMRLLPLLTVVLLSLPARLNAQVDSTKTDTVKVDTLSAEQADSLRARVEALRADSIAKDSVARDSLRADSLRAESIRRRAERAADTIKAPLPLFVPPPNTEALDRFAWNRAELMSTGAANLADLLDLVPGVATFRTSWFPGVHVASYQGDFRRIRVFLDGLELDAIDARNNGVLDLTEVSIATLDQVTVERAAGELRVWATSWTVRSTTPYTRTDIYTGDLNTNGFRGLFGRRFMNGALFQFSAQQAETSQRRQSGTGFGGGSRGTVGDGDVQHLGARVGWARGKFAVDGFFSTTNRTRDLTQLDDDFKRFSIPAYEGNRREQYLRVGYGNFTRGLSAQAMLGSMRTNLKIDDENAEPSLLVEADSTDAPPLLGPDSLVTRTQRVVQLGYAWENVSVRAFTRWRSVFDEQFVSPGVQLAADYGWVASTLHVERQGMDSSERIDGSLRLRPFSFLTLSGAISSYSPEDSTLRPSEFNSRFEGALGWRGRWVSGGIVTHAFGQIDRRIAVPRVLTPFTNDTLVPQLVTSSSTGITFGVQAPIYKDLRVEVRGIRWNDTREYRPQTQLRASVVLQSEWRSKFPKGDFGINLRFTHEQRGSTLFIDPDAIGQPELFRTLDAYNYGSALLEIRIIRATLFYQFRNVYGGTYAQVPGVVMPPPFQIYGIRWEWFN